jgi:hypothetical protein
MAVQAKAKGNGPATGMQKTPAPDEITSIRSPSQAGYGMNTPQPSSVAPGKRVLSPLAANLESSVDDDGVLAAVIAKGTTRVDSEITSQLRDIAPNIVPDHPHMGKPANSPRIPDKIGPTNSTPMRKSGT